MSNTTHATYTKRAIRYRDLEEAYMRHVTGDDEPDELWVSPRDFETICGLFRFPLAPHELAKARVDGLRFNAARMFPKGHDCEMTILRDGKVIATEMICGPLPSEIG